MTVTTDIGEAILITEDGVPITLNLPADRGHFAECAAAVLRCQTVEAFDLALGLVLWLDEEGGSRWPHNSLLDGLVNRHGFTDRFYGPALITGYRTGVAPLPAEAVRQLLMELNSLPS